MKSKVKKDQHSLYVRVNGCIFRPVETILGCHYKEFPKTGSKFDEGNVIKLNHINQTTYAKLQKEDGGLTEIWESHGCYIGFDQKSKLPKNLKSEVVWRPKPQAGT